MKATIDLTKLKDASESNMRNNLIKPGSYKLPFISYVVEDGIVHRDVEVVYVTPKTARMLVIIVKLDENTYQDFYYNDGNECFKILTVNDFNADDIDDEDLLEEMGGVENVGTFDASWVMENVKDIPPHELASYRVDPNTMYTHEFFKNIL